MARTGLLLPLHWLIDANLTRLKIDGECYSATPIVFELRFPKHALIDRIVGWADDS